MGNRGDDDTSKKLLASLLVLTKSNRTTSLEEVANHSKLSPRRAKETVASLNLEQGEPISISTQERLRLAIRLAQSGTFEGTKSLTWREFEKFVEACLNEAGFETQDNVRVKGAGREWQIDVVGYRQPLLLGFDCKHWKPPNYLSKFDNAATRQRRAVSFLARTKKESIKQDFKLSAISIILTLDDPPKRVHKGSVLLAISKLPDFLVNITPLSAELPFIGSASVNYENPIKETYR